MSMPIDNTEHTKTQLDEKLNQALQQFGRTVMSILEEHEKSLQNRPTPSSEGSSNVTRTFSDADVTALEGLPWRKSRFDDWIYAHKVPIAILNYLKEHNGTGKINGKTYHFRDYGNGAAYVFRRSAKK